MSTSATRTLVLGAAAGVIALMGALTPAVAGHRHHHHHHRHFHGWHGPVVVSSYGGCGYYRWKWRTTGSRYWKYQYLSCIY